jgi:hypothetical protein
MLASVAIALFATVSSATALPTHTWVSGANGSDSNPGTRAQPFATFQAAVNGTAAGGLVSVADPGDFGPISISKAITIDGGGVGGDLTSTGSTAAISIQAGTTDVVRLRHLVISGLGQGSVGTDVAKAGLVVVKDRTIEDFTNVGIGIDTTPTDIVVKNTTITNCTAGIFQTSLSRASLEGVTISHTIVAVTSVAGVITVSNSVITQNSTGLETSSGSSNGAINAESCILSFNTDAVSAETPGTTIRLSNNDIFDNSTGIKATFSPGNVAPAGNNKKAGNPGTGGTVGAPNSTIRIQ